MTRPGFGTAAERAVLDMFVIHNQIMSMLVATPFLSGFEVHGVEVNVDREGTSIRYRRTWRNPDGTEWILVQEINTTCSIENV